MDTEKLTYESIQLECASRGFVIPINRLTFDGLIILQGFNKDEIIGVCLDINSGYTLRMSIEQARKQKQVQIEWENQNANA